MWAVNYDKYSVHTMSNYEQLKTVYETSVFKNILHLIDGVYVPLSQKWKNIKVSKLEDYSCLQFNDNVYLYYSSKERDKDFDTLVGLVRKYKKKNLTLMK